MKWSDGRGPLPPDGIHDRPWRNPYGSQAVNRLAVLRTAVYRAFTADGKLLYVGMTMRPEDRWEAHARCSQWWPLHDRIEMEWFDTRTAAADAEYAAILHERPAYNSPHPARPSS